MNEINNDRAITIIIYEVEKALVAVNIQGSFVLVIWLCLSTCVVP